MEKKQRKIMKKSMAFTYVGHGEFSSIPEYMWITIGL